MYKHLLSLSVLLVFSFSLVLKAQEVSKTQKKEDSITVSELNPVTNLRLQDAYTLKSDVEHQKMLRNIFAVSFVFLLAALLFIVFFYGSRVKKINHLIVSQNAYLNSTKDQLQKIINVFNYIDQLVFITDSKGVIEWANSFALNVFNEDYENNKLSLLNKFSTENQGNIFRGINNNEACLFTDNIFEGTNDWKMIPISNSKNNFSNMVFIGVNQEKASCR